MKIAVVAANGKTGRLIVQEAVERGHEVTAIVRKQNQTLAKKELIKDLYDLTAEDLREFDVVVDAFGMWAPDKLYQHETSLEHLADCLQGTQTRLLIVGGAGSLYVDAEHKIQLAQTPEFPDFVKPLAQAMGEALNALRQREDVQWTYISPAAEFQAEGAKVGKYQLAGEELKVNAEGKSYISYADYAQAMVDEIEKGTHINERISVYQP